MSRFPREFTTEQDFEDKFNEYVEHCIERDRLPNVAGFASYCKMHRDTFYKQKPRYPETFDIIQSVLEDETINSKGVKEALKIFILKAKYGYRERNENEVATNMRIQIVDDLDEIE